MVLAFSVLSERALSSIIFSNSYSLSVSLLFFLWSVLEGRKLATTIYSCHVSRAILLLMD